jgi:hypothetical protein
MHLAPADQLAAALDRYFVTSADTLGHALTIHRQHLDAARSAIATNDNAAVRELLGELLTGARSARRGEGLGDAPVSVPGGGLGEGSPPPLSASRPSS